MAECVRAALITPDRTLLLMRRTRPGMPVYWVLPGGGVEPDDAGREDALYREIREEIAGKGDIVRLLHTMDGEDREFFYLVNVTSWSFEDRTGPEFTQDGRGEYHLDEVPLTEAALDELNIMPPQIGPILKNLATAGPDELTGPDTVPVGRSPWHITRELAAFLDEKAAHLPADQRRILQVLKIGEEFGEAAQAVIGVTGTNPRKGQSHTWDDVAAEVCDVMVSSMVALHRLGIPDPAAAFAAHVEKTAARTLAAQEA